MSEGWRLGGYGFTIARLVLLVPGMLAAVLTTESQGQFQPYGVQQPSLDVHRFVPATPIRTLQKSPTAKQKKRSAPSKQVASAPLVLTPTPIAPATHPGVYPSYATYQPSPARVFMSQPLEVDRPRGLLGRSAAAQSPPAGASEPAIYPRPGQEYSNPPMYGEAIVSSENPPRLRESISTANLAPRRSAEAEKISKGKDNENEKDFTATLILPALYASSAVNGNLDSTVESKGDWHATPEVALKWSRQYDFAKLSSEIGANIDRYRRTSDANGDAIFLNAKAELGNGKSNYFVPYVRYSDTLLFIPSFKQLDISLHDLAIGFSSGIGSRNGKALPYADAGDPGDGSANLDVRVGTRLSSYSDYQYRFVTARLELVAYLTDQWRLELTPKFNARWYSDYYGEKRNDYRPGIDVGLVWTPDWLQTIVKRSQIGFGFNFYRNYSNIADKTYSLWEAGPTLELKAKF